MNDYRSKHTLQKNSLMSKTPLLRDDLENKSLFDYILKTHEDLNISSKKFSNFISNKLPNWISMVLFPIIVELNMVSLITLA